MSRLQSGTSQVLGLIAVAITIIAAAVFVFMSSDPATPIEETNLVTETNGTEELEDVPGLDPNLANGGPSRTEVERTPTVMPGAGKVDDFGDLIGAAISGRVVNQNGQAVSGAAITLSQRYSNSTLMRGYNRGERFETTSGADGTFHFRNLAAGIEMNMWVAHSEYAPSAGPPFASLQGEAQYLGDITLTEGFSIHGTVTDEAGNPLAAAVEVRMQPNDAFRLGSSTELREVDEGMGRLLTVIADEQGNFKVNKLAANIWNVTARLEGYASSPKNAISLHGKPRPRTEPILIKLGEEFHIAGIVQDENKNPIAGAIINVARAQPRPVVTADAISDENGQFDVRGLQKGIYSLSAQAEGFSNGRAGRVDANTTDLIMVLQVKGGVSGRVTDANGSPVQKFSLEVLRTRSGNAMYSLTGLVHRLESADGSYSLGNLDPGSYILLARADGLAATYSAGFSVQRDMVDGIDIPMNQGGIISGRVVDAEGIPIAGAEVSLHGDEYSPDELNSLFGASLGDPNNVPTTKVRSGRDGQFRLENAYLGSVQVMVKHQLYLPQLVPSSVSNGGLNELGDVRLYRGSSIFGVAKDHDGNLLTGGSVNLTSKDSNAFFHRSTTIDARGRYRFDGLKAGSYQVVALPSAAENSFMFPPETDQRSIFLNEGQDSEVDLSSTLMQKAKKPGDRR
ncbi:MAG: carboxypeptidase regulatory-like domain-containing protein [Planctomycetes bacterium]|nr:carboxypeptidase regulatory-like domain-containing protein [Planctomycetota bacterium]MCP4772292.1 carboxypeptidase regulatory-like domain-containing protein [Planctomycetota bacterium]MCP4861608.1 carboxypeptidase regulatory-like domain-containing protein [Planctomycetota bacterium]